MKVEIKPPMDASEEIPALIETLLATKQRLEELTAGQVDTVTARNGQTFLLGHAQEELRHSQAVQQAAILNALPAHIALLDRQGLIISVNEAWRGFAKANVFQAPGHGVGINYLDVCDRAQGNYSSEAHQVAAGIRDVLDGAKKSFTIEYPCHSLREQRWFLLAVTPLAEYHPNGAVVMHLNITERRQAETAAIRLAAIVESSGDAIIGKNLVRIITSWNQGAEFLFGYTAEEMVGTSIMRLLPPGQPDEHQNILTKVRRGEKVEHFETVRQTKAGALVDISVTASPIKDATSQVIGVSIVARDITERMRAESALYASQANMAAAQRLAHFGSWELELTHSKDAHANALRWSDEMFRIAGYVPGAVEVSRELFFHLVHPEDRKPIREALAVAIRERREYSIVHRLIRPGGQTRVLQETGQIVFDEKTGQPVKIVGTAHDITERTRSEEALRESELHFRVLYENSPYCIHEIDREGRLLLMNRAGLNLMGVQEESAVCGMPYLSAVADEDKERIGRLLLLAFQGQTCEFEFKASNGLVFQSSLVPIRDAHGAVVRLMGLSHDITERTRSEQVIERGLQRLNEAQRIGQIGDWEWDIATQAITWSPQVFEIFGRDPRLGPPRKYEEMTALFDAASQALMKEKVTLAIESGEAQDYELRAHRPNGTPVDVLGRAVTRKDESGKVVGLVGTVQDITARKRSEEALRVSESRYHSLFENMVEGYAYCRTLFEQDQLRDFTYVEVNRAFERLTGLKNVVGKKVSEVIPGVYEASPELFEVFGRVALTGKPEEYETYLKPLAIWFSITVYSHEREHFVAVFDNITERKRAEAELERAHRELVKASRQAGMAEVATGILHNVGNVLNSVTVASSCVADSIRKSKAANLSKVVTMLREHAADLGEFLTLNPQGKQIPGYLAQLAEHLVGEQVGALQELAHLQKNIEHIKEIVAMQLNFVKPSGATERLSVSELLEDALKMNANALARQGIVVIREFQHVPLVMADKQQVMQILVNLVCNAQQACEGSDQLEKRLTLRVTQGEGRIRIGVADNGLGILPENLPRMFTHGFTTKKSGHGFGLHSAAEAAKEMGGVLTVYSDGFGQGATFTLELPCPTREIPHE